MTSSSNETHTNADHDNAPREATPDLTDQSSSSPESTDSDSESDFSVSSPTDLTDPGPYKPDLKKPKDGEKPQYRGRITYTMAKGAAPVPPAQDAQPPLNNYNG
ncbi:unnamed protein product [Rhizoctonia solani]|uniref:Uncharacterized protein n=1 Tax=Rhizoctonia solani TaxID=456999 RepID=A0A8H2XFT1_9AGAM|nr:unnamed protein product [Rhizoctonia solani]